MTNLGNRIVVLIDMDCFFCQVETRLQPEYAGKPLAVVQYNLWRSGGIIAVNYEARDFGVTRHMRGDEAKEKCPDIILATVPSLRGKADTSRYRSAGREVIDVLKKHCNMVERASVDEAYLDITQIVDDKLAKESVELYALLQELHTTYVVGHSEVSVNDEEKRQEGLKTWLSEMSEDVQIQRLAIAGLLVENMRKDIFETTGFRCSAGISFNKILAKLACGLHKPNRQTILPASSVPDLFGSLPIKKVRHLGGKLGDIVIDSLKCNVMADLLPYTLQQLQNRFDEKTGLWLYNIARGNDNEPVTPRLVSKSIGACKRFPGKQAIVDIETLKHWLGELSAEVCERLEQDLEENERKASLLTISFQFCQNKTSVSQSRSIALTSYKPEKMTEQCVNVVVKATQQQPISFLGLSAAKFIKAKGSENFVNFFKVGASDKSSCSVDSQVNSITDVKQGEETNKDNDDDVNVNNGETSKIEDNKKSEVTEITVTKVKRVPTQKVTNRKSSPCSSLKKSLKSDNFKKSFFMNILKDKQSNVEGTAETVVPETVSKNLDPITNSSDEVEAVYENTASTEQHKEEQAELTFFKTSPNNSVKIPLQEIFPDLNDIDSSIVQMLPPYLQEQARELSKASKETTKNVENNAAKSQKSSKVQKDKSPCPNFKDIQCFFIKTPSDSYSSNGFKKCLECGQLILIDKYDDHTDYHIALNLQEELDRRAMKRERKRKNNSETPKNSKKRFSGEVEINT